MFWLTRKEGDTYSHEASSIHNDFSAHDPSTVPTDRMSKLPTLGIIAAKIRHRQRFYPITAYFRYMPNVTDKGLSVRVTKVFTFSGF